MDTGQLDGKLTPAALQVLTEVGEDYRKQILLAAAQSASQTTGELREISVHDVLWALGKVSAPPERQIRNPVDRALYLYAAIGLLLGILGSGFYYLRPYSIEAALRSPQLLLSAAGFMMAALSYLLLRARDLGFLRSMAGVGRATPANPELVGIYISRWQQIELSIRSIASSRLGESLANEPLSALIARLRADQLLTADDGMRLRRLLDTRNKLVHGRTGDRTAEIRASLREAERILEKLSGLAAAGFVPSG